MDSARAADSFRGLLLRNRGRTGLTQRELAVRMGAGRRTVQDWEAGAKYPSAGLLQSLIAVLLAAGGLSVGHERDEAEELWAAARREAPRMHTPFDTVWFTGLLAERAAHQAPDVAHAAIPVVSAESAVGTGPVDHRQEWGEAPNVDNFVGRARELASLHDWVIEERCRLVAVLGMGGIGKTLCEGRHMVRMSGR